MGMNFYFATKTGSGWDIPYNTQVTAPFTFKDENDFEGSPNPAYIRELDLAYSNDIAAQVLSLFGIDVRHGITPDLEVTDELIDKAGTLMVDHYKTNPDLSRRIKRFRDFLRYGKDHGYQTFYGI